jgi:hypothetical protein
MPAKKTAPKTVKKKLEVATSAKSAELEEPKTLKDDTAEVPHEFVDPNKPSVASDKADPDSVGADQVDTADPSDHSDVANPSDQSDSSDSADKAEHFSDPSENHVPFEAVISDVRPQEVRGKRLFIGGILVALVVTAATAGALWMYLGQAAPSKKAVVVEQAPVVASVSTTPEPTIHQSDWVIDVLNGSGSTGMAKKTADMLKSAGYKLGKVGNNPVTVKGENQVYISKQKLEQKELLLKDLTDRLGNASFSGTLKEATPDARIILSRS